MCEFCENNKVLATELKQTKEYISSTGYMWLKKTG